MYILLAHIEVMLTEEKAKPARAMGLQHCDCDNWRQLVVRNVLRNGLMSQDCGTGVTSILQASVTVVS